MVETPASLLYHEPDIISILAQSSFLLALNVINYLMDHTLYCGLLGQVMVGITWGTPGGGLLSMHVEEVAVQLGYLGLTLLVYEGGLSTSFTALKANLLLSIAVALTGIIIPIALSFSLQSLMGASSLQAFAAGAALCSPSLGTAFTVLGTSGLITTRLGVVLSSAAMMDDVAGLVLVQVISNLGGDSNSDIDVVLVVRPVLVSLAFAIVPPLVCHFVIKPVTLLLKSYREKHTSSLFQRVLQLRQTAFVIHALILVGSVAGASYAGISNLFTSYIAGAAISWWDSELSHPSACNSGPRGKPRVRLEIVEPLRTEPSCDSPYVSPHGSRDGHSTGDVQQEQSHSTVQELSTRLSTTAGIAIYEDYFGHVVSRILKPLFFASIGFSIPITRMFSGGIVWRGIVYTILMMFGKLVCGIWLIRLPSPPIPQTLQRILAHFKLASLPHLSHLWGRDTKQSSQSPTTALQTKDEAPQMRESVFVVEAQDQTSTMSSVTNGTTSSRSSPNPRKSLSLQPAFILAFAMTARGEIGFLISAVAESRGVLSSTLASDRESDIFLIVTWAIFLCTIIGPLGVGLLVRRIKGLEAKRGEGAREVLGAWGVR